MLESLDDECFGETGEKERKTSTARSVLWNKAEVSQRCCVDALSYETYEIVIREITSDGA